MEWSPFPSVHRKFVFTVVPAQNSASTLSESKPLMLVDLPIGATRQLKVAGNPIQFAGAPVARHTAAPRLDQDRDALLRELGIERAPLTT